MANIFNKPRFDKQDWQIYLDNLNLLRIAHGIKTKREFNQEIGVANAFRKDMNKPDKMTVRAICSKFNVTESWLSEKHEDFRDQNVTDSLAKENKAAISVEVLFLVIKGVEDYLKASQKELPPEKKARLVALLYDHFVGTGRDVDQGTVVEYLKLVA